MTRIHILLPFFLATEEMDAFSVYLQTASSFGAAGSDFLAFFVPGVNPAALPAGEGVAGGREDVAHVADSEGMQFLALGVAGVVPAAVLEDVERLAVGNNFALGSAESVNLLAVLVIDVVPRAGGLDITDSLGLHGVGSHEHGEDNKDSSHNHYCFLLYCLGKIINLTS